MTVARCFGLTLAFVAIMVTGVEGQESPPPPALIEEGSRIFAGPGLCFACHGPTGGGIERVGPDLTDDNWLHGDGSLDSIVSLIQTGVLEGSKTGVLMPPRGGTQLSDEQVRAVAAYVWSLSRPRGVVNRTLPPAVLPAAIRPPSL